MSQPDIDARPDSDEVKTAAAATTPDESGPSYLTVTKTFSSWAFTLDHKRIGLMYLCGVLYRFLLGGIFALLASTELFSPLAMLTPCFDDAAEAPADRYHK